MSAGGGTITYLEAITDGLREEMRLDSSVYLLGEDIGAYGGAFKVTKGLIEEFGPWRVIDTIVAESAILGAAIGSAIAGMRPVAEMQFADFVACGFNQLVNLAAKAHYRWGQAVPLVVRLPSGGYVHGGPFHSQNPEAWFCSVPGLKVVAPSMPADAYGLIRSSIRDDNPVVFLEHKFLYRRIKSAIVNEPKVPLGRSIVYRPGRDAGIVTYGSGVHLALAAAEALAQEGIEVEVHDLRTLVPYDRESLSETVRRTHRVLVLHEASMTGGFGAEIAAWIGEALFEHLDAPVRRLAGEDVPVPYHPVLEDRVLPNTEKVTRALRELIAY
ncbi:MAG: alpha-ketoacid dehydrogenase subunit beta [Candidatus Eisenbacteria bacterium]|nr:alpha-ketoacid dehydrogenase subunit beta [Candidatus Eisenbacteria bacterium]